MSEPASHYTAGGRGHRVLAQIADQPRGRRDLEAIEPSARTRRKLPYLLGALVRDGLIRQFCGAYQITDEGLVLLDHLDAREQPRAGSARLFGKAA